MKQKPHAKMSLPARKESMRELSNRCMDVKFIHENLQEATMNRSRLLNRYRREKQKQITLHKKYREIFVWKTKEEFYNNRKTLFRKAVKLLFTDKTSKVERISYLSWKAVSDETKLVEMFSKYFRNIIHHQGIDALIFFQIMAL